MRGGAGRTLLKSLSFNSKSFPSIGSLTPNNGSLLQRLRHLATATGKPPRRAQDREHGTPESESRTKRDSMILEMFRRRQLEGSGKEGKEEPDVASDGAGPTKVVTSFKELGLGKAVIKAMGKLGVAVPSEVQCLGIPAVLEGKSLILIGPSESGKTWAYLSPLIQRLREDAASCSLKRESPRALVLCPSEELCDQVFCAAKLISNHARESENKEIPPGAPIGMLVGTPEEILQQVKDQDVILTEIRYLVLDEADIMLDSDLFQKIHKIFSLFKDRLREDASFQTILVASTSEKILGMELVETLEQKESGKLSAIILEMDLPEVPGLFKSPDALRSRVAEAVTSLGLAPSST